VAPHRLVAAAAEERLNIPTLGICIRANVLLSQESAVFLAMPAVMLRNGTKKHGATHCLLWRRPSRARTKTRHQDHIERQRRSLALAIDVVAMRG
jgi:hypothetical protein